MIPITFSLIGYNALKCMLNRGLNRGQDVQMIYRHQAGGIHFRPEEYSHPWDAQY